MIKQRAWYIKTMRRGIQCFKKSKSYEDYRYIFGGLSMAFNTDIIDVDEYDITFNALQKLYYKEI